MEEFFTILALCHNCEAQKSSQGIFYKGDSRDEVTLVDAARNLGFAFVNECSTFRTLDVHGEKRHYEIVFNFPFTPDRRKSSIIVQQDGYYKLMVKGSDEDMYQRLLRSTASNPNRALQEIIEDAYDNIDVLADKGMRNICVAERLMNTYEVQEVSKRIKQALSQNRPELICKWRPDPPSRDRGLHRAQPQPHRLPPWRTS